MDAKIVSLSSMPLKLGEIYTFLMEELNRCSRFENVEEAVSIILEVITGLKTLDVILNKERLVGEAERIRIFEVLQTIKGGEPLAYALGEWFFAGRLFYVNKHVLIPRPETEALLLIASEYLRQMIQDEVSTKLRVLELGVGSGALIISLALEFPSSITYGTDISIEAIQVARRNKKRYNVNTRLYRGDLFFPFERSMRFHLIVSNPPYVEDASALDKDVLKYEPLRALLVPQGKRGTYYHNLIAEEARHWLYPGGALAMEVGFSQAEDVRNILSTFRYENIIITKDTSGIDRVVSGKWLG